MLALKAYALIAVMDYFNCKDGEEEDEEVEEPKPKKRKSSKKKKEKKPEPAEGAFRKKCETEVMTTPEGKETSEWVMEYLWGKLPKKQKGNTSIPLSYLISFSPSHGAY